MLEIKQLTRLQIIRYCEKLEKENKKLKADTEHTIKFNNKIIGKLKLENDKLKEENKWFKKKNKQAGKYVAATMKENKKLRDNYYNLSKIVEVSGGYKASYVNELRDKIAKLEYMRKTDAEYIKRLQS